MEAQLLNVMGDDLTVVNAARVSFHKTSSWEPLVPGCEPVPGNLSEKDKKLINYLAKHGHWTPFGHCSASFRLKAPLFVARQLGKSTVGFVWNEVSRRYVDEEPECYFPSALRLRPSSSIKQGSSSEVWKQTENTPDLMEWMYSQCQEQFNLYNELIKQDIAPEQARMVLPQNTMTEWWWTGSLAAWSRVFKLRLDPHTQQETRELVQIMHDQLVPAFPNALKALMES